MVTIGFVVDREVFLIAEKRNLLAQNLDAEGVEGGNGEIAQSLSRYRADRSAISCAALLVT